MIRFIDLGKQIGLDEEWPREFAFFNTVDNKFVTINNEQTWQSWEDFLVAINTRPHLREDLKRFKNLCPDWVFNKELSDGK